jgi:hypothetical protein
MKLDIRIPIGLLFALFGAVLTVFGLVSDPAIYRMHSHGLNINLGWGLVQLAFGATMLRLAYRARRARP